MQRNIKSKQIFSKGAPWSSTKHNVNKQALAGDGFLRSKLLYSGEVYLLVWMNMFEQLYIISVLHIFLAQFLVSSVCKGVCFMKVFSTITSYCCSS